MHVLTVSSVSPLRCYTARDGGELRVRYYPAPSDQVLILLNGISEDGKYLHPLAEYVSSKGLAAVYTPDPRDLENLPSAGEMWIMLAKSKKIWRIWGCGSKPGTPEPG